MQFSTSIVLGALASLGSMVSAENIGVFTLTSAQSQSGFTAGNQDTIMWTPGTSGTTVSLFLFKGAAANKDNISTIATSIPNSGSFPWTPATSLVTGTDYSWEIVNVDNQNDMNWSADFTIHSSGGAASSTTSSTTSGAIATAAPTSSSATGTSNGNLSSNTATAPNSTSSVPGSGMKTFRIGGSTLALVGAVFLFAL